MRVVSVPGTFVMIPSRNFEAQHRKQVQGHPGVPGSLTQIQADLNARDCVSLTFDAPRRRGDNPSLLVHGSTYAVRLFLRNNAGNSRIPDSYTIAGVLPLRLRDHHRLATGCLLVRHAQWLVVPDAFGIPPNSDSHWARLVAEWASLSEDQVTSGTPALTATQETFLDTVAKVVEATERIAIATARSAKPFTYRKVAPTGELRHGTHSAYDFQLVAPQPPDKGTFVQVRGEAEQRGQVTRVGERIITVRFDRPVDFVRIPQQGYLEETPSTVAYQKQREAVGLLRDRRAANTRLLSAVVDNRLEPLRPANAEPTTRLDDDQREAFGKALAVEDMLLVLGPPGTGKTRTISQIVGAVASEPVPNRDNRRVLVTSHTNRAVDNVLPRLPSELLTVRVGSESGVTEEGKPYLLERLAADLREEVVRGVEAGLDAHSQVEHAASWGVELDRRIDGRAAATAREARALAELAAARREFGGAAQVLVDQWAAEHAAGAARLRRCETVIEKVLPRRQRAVDRGRLPVLGGLFRLLARRADRRLARASAELTRLRELNEQACRALQSAHHELDIASRDVPAVRAVRATVAAASRDRTEADSAAGAAADACRAAVAAVATAPVVRDDPSSRHEDLQRLSSWLHAMVPVLRARAQLLAAWQAEVAGETSQLYPELIRYADVLAATCVGAASRPELSDVDFELVVVDEAGQIGVPDALIPLVRARRAVLVGDHRQLPPFLDTEVEAWGAADGDPVVRALLSTSVLELLVRRFPRDNIVQLTWQRRMPAVIADFISTAFYDGELHTGVHRTHRDELFAQPFAFVDTSTLPARTRAESRSGQRQEAWGRAGYVNHAEADLLVRLAAYYHRRGADWAVIVPYRAQVDLISRRLDRLVGNSGTVELNVGTVDSFQGGERDVILYGFTRSNQNGSVGFLDELRRANVAFTRAKNQLVLVGDLATLTNATNRGFLELVRSLRDHVIARGDLRGYREVLALLDETSEEVGR
jgi:hypothetical protein